MEDFHAYADITLDEVEGVIVKGLVSTNNAAAGVDVNVSVGGKGVEPDREQ